MEERLDKKMENNIKVTMVVGRDAAQTPSRLSVLSSTPDATTC